MVTIPIFNDAASIIKYNQPLYRSIALKNYRAMNSNSRAMKQAMRGVSGSGKSSLAFGIIYAEAQRRNFESVAPYARRPIDQVGELDVDAIDGLPPRRSHCSSAAPATHVLR